MHFRNKTVLVTGGAGFIGSHLADRLLNEGAEKVTVLDNFCAGASSNVSHLKDNPKVEIVEGDVQDRTFIKGICQNKDYVFHEAASKLVMSLKDPRIDVMTNVVGTFNVLEAVKDTDSRFVYAGTGSVFGSADKPMEEGHVKDPTTVYGISKLAAEKYTLHFAKEFGLKASVIRYFHVYGPRQDYSGEAGVVSIFLSSVLKGKPPLIFSGGHQIRCFTYVSDDVDATLLLAKKNSAIGQDYNVASKARVSIKELAEMIIEKYAKVKMQPIFGKDRPGENARPIPDTTKIEKLGFSAKIDFEDGLEKTKQWVAKKESL